MEECKVSVRIANKDEWMDYLNSLVNSGVELQDKETKKINPIVFDFDFKLAYDRIS